jgi:hypothetical protein
VKPLGSVRLSLRLKSKLLSVTTMAGTSVTVSAVLSDGAPLFLREGLNRCPERPPHHPPRPALAEHCSAPCPLLQDDQSEVSAGERSARRYPTAGSL